MQKHIWHRKLQTKGTVIGLFKIKQTYELDNKYKALSLKFKKKTKGKVNIQRFNSQIQSALTLHNNNCMTNTFVHWNTDKYIIKVYYKLVSYKKKSDLPMPFFNTSKLSTYNTLFKCCNCQDHRGQIHYSDINTPSGNT